MTTASCVLKIASHTQMNDMDYHPFRARRILRHSRSQGQLDDYNPDRQNVSLTEAPRRT